jgi:N-hydroxyarylamine O-acetyltransferase
MNEATLAPGPTPTNTVPPVDLDAYCARIGYGGPREPTLETLRALQALHAATIPFEAIDVQLDRGVDLSPEAVDAKLIGAGRGGYCFEQNNLFMRVLATVGFSVEGLMGRVRWSRPVDAPPLPRTHMALRVPIDGEPWLADVGFGSCMPTAPLRLSTDAPQPTAHEDFRIRPQGGSQVIEVLRGGEWLPLYDLFPEPQLAVDYELANWYTATHPNSPFRQNLMVSRATPEARYGLLDGRLTVRRADGAVEQRQLDAAQLENALANIFGLPVTSDWRPVIERAVAATPAA